MSTQTEKLIIDVNEKQGLIVDIKNKSSILVGLEGKQPVAVSGMKEGAGSYNSLRNKPSINEIILIGNKTSKQLHLQDEMSSLTNLELENLIKF